MSQFVMSIIIANSHEAQAHIGDTEEKEKQPSKLPFDVSWDELKDLKYLTSGGSSNICKAVFRGEPVIIKLLKPELTDDEILKNDMESEIQILSKLDHPHIVKIHGAGYNSKQQRFIILEQLNGGTLEKIFDGNSKNITRSKSLPLKDVISNALAIARAMRYFHSALDGYAILHRDLKPDNIGRFQK